MNEQPSTKQQQQSTIDQTPPRVEQGAIAQEPDTGFLPEDRMVGFRERWNDVQVAFVDDPQNAVQQAHALVTELTNDLVQTFTTERSTLETQWKGGGNADTEQLRVALQRYRSFFNRLLGT